jgi:hypothetical protein
VALASGVAAFAGAALLLAGRIDGSVLTVLALLLAARAAALAASPGVAGVSRALGRHAALVPAWVGVLVVAVVRAGSERVADVRGANAVAGLAIARGGALLVAGVWAAALAGIVAIAASDAGVPIVAGPVARRLEAVAALGQVAFVVAMFAGPSVSRATDVVPWVLGAVVVGAAAWFGARVARWDRAAAVAAALATLGVVLALAGGRL